MSAQAASRTNDTIKIQIPAVRRFIRRFERLDREKQHELLCASLTCGGHPARRYLQELSARLVGEVRK
jgi:hypothetical protein